MTAEQRDRASRVLALMADAVLEAVAAGGADGVPSGMLYAAFMQAGLSLEQYQAILRGLERAGRITVKNHLVRLANKKFSAPAKTLDAHARAVVVSTQSTSAPPAITPEAPGQPAAVKETVMQLTYKGHSRKGKVAVFTGLARPLWIPVSLFADPSNIPTTFSVSDGIFTPAKVKESKPKLTKEERAALRASKPKPTLAEQIAAREARLAKMKAKLAAEGGQHASA